MADVTVTNNADRQRYEARITGGDTVAGFADYRADGDRVVMPHTVVDPAHGGQGIGGQLARFALDDIRSQGRTVVPRCSFIRDWIDRHPEYADLVA